MTTFVAGIDVGTSRTRCAIAAVDGSVRSLAVTGPGNPLTVGFDGLGQTVREAFASCVSDAGIDEADVSACGVGVAGFNWPSQRDEIEAALCSVLPGDVRAMNDALLALHAGARRGWGVSLAAGTSCNCRGVDVEGRQAGITGISMLDEAPGASEIVLAALRAVARREAGRGAATSLAEALVAISGARDVADLLEGIGLWRYPDAHQWAPAVLGEARRGDAVATQIFEGAVAAMVDIVCGVATRLGIAGGEFDVVLSGGLFGSADLLLPPLCASLAVVAPGAAITLLDMPPVAGGVVVALRAAAGDDASVDRVLHDSHGWHDVAGDAAT